VGWLAGLWAVAVIVELLRFPTMGSFVLLDLILRAVVWLVALASTFGVARDVSPRALRWGLPLAGALAIAPFFNWSQLSPRWWFETHRPFYDAAVANPVDEREIGVSLPLYLRWLSVDGNAQLACVDGCEGSDRATPNLFFPQWYGMHDDAGGYAYSPAREPQGMDMSGMLCQNPTDLGDGWWMCGM